jgi:hypothetical protein
LSKIKTVNFCKSKIFTPYHLLSFMYVAQKNKKRIFVQLSGFPKRGKLACYDEFSDTNASVSSSFADFLNIHFYYLGWSLGVGPSLQCDEMYDCIS